MFPIWSPITLAAVELSSIMVAFSFGVIMKKIITAGLLVFSSVVAAHEDASDPGFCAKGELVMLSETRISGDALLKITDNKAIDCPVGMDTLFTPDSESDAKLKRYIGGAIAYRNPSYRHDFFDEPERLAYAYASCSCASIINRDINTQRVRPMINGPQSLVSEAHHSIYNLEDGLSFGCYVCKE